MSRTFTGYASAYSANQTQVRTVRRAATRTLVANFNGALDAGRTIASVEWACTAPWVTKLSNAAINAAARSVSVDVVFNYSGLGDIKATITLDDGARLNYEFAFTVTDAPLYPSDTFDTAAGPYSITADAA